MFSKFYVFGSHKKIFEQFFFHNLKKLYALNKHESVGLEKRSKINKLSYGTGCRGKNTLAF